MITTGLKTKTPAGLIKAGGGFLILSVQSDELNNQHIQKSIYLFKTLRRLRTL